MILILLLFIFLLDWLLITNPNSVLQNMLLGRQKIAEVTLPIENQS